MENNLILTFFVSIAVICVAVYLFKRRKRFRREMLYELEFPEKWQKILKIKFPLYKRLPDSLRKQLHGRINIFLNEKYFQGYNGLEITDTIRVVIAAQACILLLNRKTNNYPHLKTIMIYPTVFKDGHKTDTDKPARLGESWNRGPVVLSWKHSARGAKDDRDGENVVIHEFAHQLDQEDGKGDGLPMLQHNNFQTWGKVLSKEFNTLKVKTRLNKRSLLNKYGATNPAEFFAVITEHFIEQPKKLKRTHPELYAELKTYYQIDPVEWL